MKYDRRDVVVWIAWTCFAAGFVFAWLMDKGFFK